MAVPGWMYIAYQLQMLSLTFEHTYSARVLERQLLTVIGVPPEELDEYCSHAGDRVTNVKTQPRGLWIQSVIVFGGGALAVVILTIVTVAEASTRVGHWWIAFAVLYTTLALGALVGTRAVLGLDRADREPPAT